MITILDIVIANQQNRRTRNISSIEIYEMELNHPELSTEEIIEILSSKAEEIDEESM